MSRVAKLPITVPKGVEIVIEERRISVKGKKGVMHLEIGQHISVSLLDDSLRVEAKYDDRKTNALAGTTRANLANMITGMSVGYEKKLTMVGVGYRAQSKGDMVSLSLGYSHPIEFSVPEGITIETPTQTEIVIKGYDKQQIGQIAANIRSKRPPEPYKGKGIRYSDEQIVRKEAKKK